MCVNAQTISTQHSNFRLNYLLESIVYFTIWTAMTKLFMIKSIHTVIWLFFNVVIFYLLYAVFSNKIDMWVWICIGIILLESIVLVVFKSICPITLIARKYSNSTKSNFDIFLPEWLAKYNKLIYSVLFGSIIILLVYRLITNKWYIS